MKFSTSPQSFLELCSQYPVIDVRSPGEFSRGHIPGSHNVALLSDSERADVGTIYKRQGREAAVARGWEFVRPKLNELVQSVQAVSPTPNVLVHCWRGGMRSNGVAELLEEHGFRPQTLGGGYKAFRRLAHETFAEPRRIVILGGFTGSGKTQLLQKLADAGEQVVDLERLARHRGSAFGGIGQAPQPTAEQFENDLFWLWRDLDPNRMIWLESESHMIGKVPIPEPIWEQMLAAPAIHVDVSREDRIEFLLDQYGHFPREQLRESLTQIKKRLGGDRLKQALEALANDDLAAVAEVVLNYYDKAYTHALAKRVQSHHASMTIPPNAQAENLDSLVQLAGTLL